jgi:3-oxoacyl-[acyl-carrier protein] reductase
LYAQIGLTRSWPANWPVGHHREHGRAPGFIFVERHADVPDDVKKAYLASVPAGRMELPATSQTVSFLASEGAGFITGQRIVVHCGRSLGNRTPVHIPW